MSKTNEAMNDAQFQAMDLPVNQIEADYDWNNRLMLDGADTFHKGTKEGGDKPAMSGQTVEDLAKLIDQSKNFVPITVSLRVDKDGNPAGYFLVAGFRRLAAVKHLGWKTVPAMVAKMTPAQEVEWNILENKARKDLNTYETARGVMRLAAALEAEGKSRKGGKGAEGKGAEGWGSYISKRLGMSRTAVNLYIRLFAKLDKKVIAAWEKGTQIPLTLLDQWASEKPARQVELFKAWGKLAEGAADAGEGGEGGEGSEGGEGGDTAGGNGKSEGPAKPSTAQVVYALAMFQDAAKNGKDADVKAIAKHVAHTLEWVLGKRKTLQGFDIAEVIRKAKEEAKAKKNAANEDAENVH